MTQYTIHTLMVDALRSVKGTGTFQVDEYLPVVCPVLSFYLIGGNRRILIDTGAGSRHNMVRALAAAGCSPADIDTVILTHLHFDHCGDADLFPHARFFVQKTEWEFAHDPTPAQQNIYVPSLLDQVGRRHPVFTEDGDSPAPGITLLNVPGHTPGSQAVSVCTAGGLYVVAGDLINIRHNLYPAMPTITDLTGRTVPCTPLPDHDIYPPGILTDMGAWHTSVQRLISLTGDRDRIIPSHDPSLPGRVFPESQPKSPASNS